MEITYQKYLDAVYGGWLGKCIGGAIGAMQENNKGLLEVRTENGKVTDQVRKVMEAENSDRRLVFEVVARKQNSTPEFVAPRWAARMAERAPSGVWIQTAGGDWQVKP